MKAVSPVRHPSRKAPTSGCCCGDGGGGELALRCLSEHGCYKGNPALGEEEPPSAATATAALCLQCDMNDCYSRLRKLVPTIPPNKRVSKVEILQHVIDYILDLQLALETHPALLRPSPPPPPPPPLHPASYPGGLPGPRSQRSTPTRTSRGERSLFPPPGPASKSEPIAPRQICEAGAVNKQGDSILCR